MDEEFSKPISRVTKLQPVDSYLSGSWEALGAVHLCWLLYLNLAVWQWPIMAPCICIRGTASRGKGHFVRGPRERHDRTKGPERGFRGAV